MRDEAASKGDRKTVQWGGRLAPEFLQGVGGSRRLSHSAGPNHSSDPNRSAGPNRNFDPNRGAGRFGRWGLLLVGLVGCETERKYDDAPADSTTSGTEERSDVVRGDDGGTTNTTATAGSSGSGEGSVNTPDTDGTASPTDAKNSGDSEPIDAGVGIIEGVTCARADECPSGVCSDGVCQDASCADGVVNGGETAVDCGGPCGGCGDDASCNEADDCLSGVCADERCQTASCTDTIRNGTESQADCGGSCEACVDGAMCNTAEDCLSGVCANAMCQVPTCNDEVRNGTEAGKDCGGECSPCSIGSSCTTHGDCISGVCEEQECLAAPCGDGILAASEACDDGNEDSADGCNADCSQIEDGFACPLAGEDCVNTQMCGDGVTQGNERCDLGDSNSDTGDCTTACQWPACGDGFVQAGEQCDDGRLSGAYGTCDEGCIHAPRCGDGQVQSAMEECDEGEENNVGGYDGCTSDCQWGPRCGDGIVDVDHDEACDDGDDIEVNGCGPSCRITSGLSRWFQFEEGSGSEVVDFAGRGTVAVEYGRRYSFDIPYTDAFVPATDESDGYIELNRATGVDPTDEEDTNPIVYVDLQDMRPSGNQLTLSVWGRRASQSNEKPLLLWMGSDGDGAGGWQNVDGEWAPHHEVWMRSESAVEGEPDKYNMTLGFTPSYIHDIAEYAIPIPSPEPETAACRSVGKVTLGEWHHFVLTIKNLQNPDGASLIRPVARYVAYVDGQRTGGASECYSVNLERFRAAFLGRTEFASSASSWKGDVDNFMIYSRELNEEEVADLYASQKK